MYNCPNDNQLINYEHNAYNREENHFLDWRFKFFNTNAYNCRMIIKADRKLNGKLMIELAETAK